MLHAYIKVSHLLLLNIYTAVVTRFPNEVWGSVVFVILCVSVTSQSNHMPRIFISSGDDKTPGNIYFT